MTAEQARVPQPLLTGQVPSSLTILVSPSLNSLLFTDFLLTLGSQSQMQCAGCVCRVLTAGLLWDCAGVGSWCGGRLNPLLITAAILLRILISTYTYVLKLLHTYPPKAIRKAHKDLCLSFLDSLHLQDG